MIKSVRFACIFQFLTFLLTAKCLRRADSVSRSGNRLSQRSLSVEHLLINKIHKLSTILAFFTFLALSLEKFVIPLRQKFCTYE